MNKNGTGIYRNSQSLYSATLIHSQSRMIKNYFLFLVIPVHANQLDSGVLLVYSALFCCHSASFRYTNVFRYHSCLFRLIPVSFGFIPESFRIVPAIPVYSGLFRFIYVSFRCHSVSFRYTPVPFLFIPSHSGIFRFIPVYSVPFRSVPFLCLETPPFFM